MDGKPLLLALSGLVATTLASSPARAEVTSPLLAGLRPNESSPYRFYAPGERKTDLLQPNPALLGEGYLTMLSSPSAEVVVPSRVDGDTDLGTFAIRFSQHLMQSFGLPAFVGVVPIPPRYLAGKAPDQPTFQIAPTGFGSPTGIAAYGTF